MSTKTLVPLVNPAIAENTVQLLSTDPVSPITNQFWFNTTSKQLKYYNGSSIAVIGLNRNYTTTVTPIDINTPVNLTGTTNVDWGLGKVFYKPDVNGDVTFTFSNVTDKDIVIIVEPTLNFYNYNSGLTINFPQPFYSDNYSGYNTTPLTFPSPAKYGLFYISSKAGDIYIKGYNLNSNQPPLIASKKISLSWGAAGSGILGDNTTDQKSSPIQIAGNHNFINMAGGSNLSLGLKQDGSVWSWGNNSYGGLGDNTTANKSSPVLVIGNHTFNNIAAGAGGSGIWSYSFGIKATGQAWSWGRNTLGQLGDNTTVVGRSSPVLVVGNHTFIKISAGANDEAIGLKNNGSIWSWGINQNYGNLGDNTTNNRSSPVAVVGNHSFINIGYGSDVGFGLKIDGSVWGWGYNDFGQLGYNDLNYRSSPVAVVGNHSFINIVVCQNCTAGLKIDGSTWCWGLGAIGDGNTFRRSSPVSVIGNHSFIKIVGGSGNFFGIKTDSIWAWGSNNAGQLGLNNTNSVSSPVQIIGNYFGDIYPTESSFSLGLQR